MKNNRVKHIAQRITPFNELKESRWRVEKISLGDNAKNANSGFNRARK